MFTRKVAGNRMARVALAALGLGALLGLIAGTAAGASPACPVCDGPPDKVTVGGPGLAGAVDVTDREAVRSLGVDVFFGLSKQRQAIVAPVVGDGYELVRYYNTVNGSFDRLRYYPSAPGGSGTIYYVGPTSGGQALAHALGLDARVGQWFMATPQEDAAMQHTLTTLNAPPQASAAPEERAQARDVWPQTIWLLALVLGTLGVVGVFGVSRRWRRRQPRRDWWPMGSGERRSNR
jgi:hypothetical protein